MKNNVDSTQKSPIIISACPGFRGLERGLERVFRSIRVAAYVEIEAFIVENLLAAMESGLVAPAPIWTNLKTFDPKPFRDRIDGIVGGYPCQPFSAIGKQLGKEDPRHLWPFLYECFNSIRPIWGFLENVSNHLNIGYEQVKRDLEGLGYTVKEGIYSAREVGSSHIRERLFVLALDHAFSERLERYAWNDSEARGWQKPKRPIASASLFPSDRSKQRKSFEEDCTIESSMVYTIDGYNFTEDLHRAIGNSVVEQTAELAFLDLLSKHFY